MKKLKAWSEGWKLERGRGRNRQSNKNKIQLEKGEEMEKMGEG